MPAPSIQPLLTSTLLLQSLTHYLHASDPNSSLLLPLLIALQTTKRLLDSSQIEGSAELFNVEKYDSETLKPLDDKITSTLPSTVITTLKSSYLLPLSPSLRHTLYSNLPPSLILESIDPMISIHRSELSLISSLIHTQYNIPLGHTEYSWSPSSNISTLPPGHTPYSYPPPKKNPQNDYIALRSILQKVRTYERSPTFRRMHLKNILALKQQDGVDFTRQNFAYGTTTFTGYFKLCKESECYRNKIRELQKLNGSVTVLGSSLGLLNNYISNSHGLRTKGIELLDVLVAKSKQFMRGCNVKNEFIAGDFMEESFEEEELIWLTSMCWDSSLRKSLYSKLSLELKTGCVVVDYKKGLEDYGFEIRGEVEVECSWSRGQRIYVFEKVGGEEKEKDEKEESFEIIEKEDYVEVVLSKVIEEVEEKVVEKYIEKAESKPTKTPVKTTTTTCETPKRDDEEDKNDEPSGSPVSPAVAVGVAAGVGILGMLINKFMRK